MPENKSKRINIIIAMVILAVAAGSFAVNYFITKKRAELQNNDGSDFSQVMKVLKNDKVTEPVNENVRYAAQSSDKNIIEIKEKMFIAQINDVYLNADDYFGKTIKLEGMFKQDEVDSKTYSFVIRYGPGCCGYDGNAGFEIAWSTEKPYPEADSWVEVVGVLKSYEEDQLKYLYLDLISLNVLEKRGAETVYQ